MHARLLGLQFTKRIPLPMLPRMQSADVTVARRVRWDLHSGGEQLSSDENPKEQTHQGHQMARPPALLALRKAFACHNQEAKRQKDSQVIAHGCLQTDLRMEISRHNRLRW